MFVFFLLLLYHSHNITTMTQPTANMTIKELSEICIKNNIKDWESMSINEIVANVTNNVHISMPRMSLEAIKEQFPVLNKQSLDIDYDDLENSLCKVFGEKLIPLNTANIEELRIPGTYYMVDLDYLSCCNSSNEREKCLTTITLIKFEDRNLTVYSHDREYTLIALDECKNSEERMYNDLDNYAEYDDHNENYTTQRYIFTDTF